MREEGRWESPQIAGYWGVGKIHRKANPAMSRRATGYFVLGLAKIRERKADSEMEFYADYADGKNPA